VEYRRIPQHVGHVAELIIAALALMFLSLVAELRRHRSASTTERMGETSA